MRALKILFVENHAVFAAAVTSSFLEEHTVEVAPAVAAALAALARTEYDVVLVDYDLDDLKGDELVREMRAGGSRTPVVAVSAHATGNDALMQAGADATCPKLGFAAICGIINDVIGSKPRPG